MHDPQCGVDGSRDAPLLGLTDRSSMYEKGHVHAEVGTGDGKMGLERCGACIAHTGSDER